MILDSFGQDVRVGLRVLFKEKSFCFLAVLVLGLGIGGATTQFTIVNAIVLRGFSFPHPEQLVGVGLIDPKASDQNKPGAEKVTILGDEIWRRDFGADPNIVGQSVRINGKAATIIGVMPPNFKFPQAEELWTPLYNEYPPQPRGDLRLGASNNAPAVMGRLKQGVTLDQANAEFIALARHLAEDNPKTNQNFTSASVQPLLNAFTGVQFRQQVWGMLAAVILVLLIACVNVMNMQFGRAALRAKELAIRGALGATRWRIVRQMLTESLVVAVFGAIAGVIIAYWALDFFVRAINTLPFPAPYYWRFTIDGPVLVFTVVITLLATIASGLVPAFLSARGNAAEIMKEGGRGNSNRLVNVITRVLVVAQIALTAGLLIAATLEIKSIRNQMKLDYGYDENAVYAARMGLMQGAYPNDDARREFFKRAVRSLRANPQFDSAAMSSRFRMTFDAQGQYEVDGQNYLTDRDRPRGNFESVSDNYFSTLGLKILEGRDFTVDDADSKQPVAIVNASFARKYWGNQSALGHQIRIFNPGKAQPWRTIVGVVPDTLMQGPFDQQTEAAGFFMPLLGASPAPQFCTILVRPRAGQRADTLGPALSRAVAELDSNLPTYFPGTPGRFHAEILSGSRVIATLFSMVMTQGAWQLAIGLVLGAGGIALLLGVVAAAALKNILFKVNALDPSIYLAVAGLLTLVAAASCFVPARRATRVDPIEALRSE